MSTVYSCKLKLLFYSWERRTSEDTVLINPDQTQALNSANRSVSSPVLHSQPSGLQCLGIPTALALPPTEQALRLQSGSLCTTAYAGAAPSVRPLASRCASLHFSPWPCQSWAFMPHVTVQLPARDAARCSFGPSEPQPFVLTPRKYSQMTSL